MRTFGLIGFPLGHSFSQKYFTEKFKREGINDCEFLNFPLENIAGLPELIRNNPSLCGLSITIPHKQNVIEHLDEVGGAAREIGAVNCISISPKSQVSNHKSQENSLIGYNTDVYGFEKSLKPLLKPHHKKALVLGCGGAAKAVAWVLAQLKINFCIVSRTKGDLSYSSLTTDVIKEHTLIINTTPLGMHPKVNECPELPYQSLTPSHLLYDLTYNPEETLFLKKGKEKGAQIKNGLEMLQLQAEKAWEIWNQAPSGH